MSSTRPPLSKRCHVCGYRYEVTLTECPVDDVALGRERPGIDRLGPYRLVERLGAGGMGAVYRAVHEKVGRAVAVKLLHRSLRTESVSVSRFFQEARAVNTIRHPNVVEIYDLSGEGEDLYMVLELLRGHDLRSAVDAEPGRRLSPERVVPILEQICGALQVAHGRNIVHRDLKPENVFLLNRQGRSDFVKLLDFGIAKLERPEGRLTREGIALGTPEYMAPEQARGAEVDGRTDIYAVGCIAYEMLTGRTVFEGKSPGDIMVKQVKEAPQPLRKLNPAVPEALEQVILRCLAKSPNARPQNGLELAHELAAAMNVPFDTTGAFMSWRSWDGSSAVSGSEFSEVKSIVALKRTLNVNVSRMLTGVFHKRRWTTIAAGACVALVGLVAWAGLRPGRGAKLDEATPTIAVGAPAAAASALAPRVQKIESVLLQSSPPGAEVFDVSGRTLGVTPFHLRLPAGEQQMTVRFERTGYRVIEREIRVDGHQRTVAVELERVAVAKAGRPKKTRAGREASSPPRKLESTTRTINPF